MRTVIATVVTGRDRSDFDDKINEELTTGQELYGDYLDMKLSQSEDEHAIHYTAVILFVEDDEEERTLTP